MKPILHFPPQWGILLTGALLLLGGCAPREPDLEPFANAIKWLGTCMVLASVAWAVGIVLFGRSRK